MGKKKRKKQSSPKRWRFKRAQRLQAADSFIKSYTGKNIVAGYAGYFHCEKVCAAVELRMLGVPVSDAEMEKLNEARHQKLRANLKRELERKEAKLAAERSEANGWNDELCYIVDYAFGQPYGTTWKEIGEDGPPWRELEEEMKRLRKRFEALPVHYAPLRKQDDAGRQAGLAS